MLFYQLLEHNVQGIFRLQEGGTNEEIFSFWQSADEDKIIEYNPSNTVKHDLKKQGYMIYVVGEILPIISFAVFIGFGGLFGGIAMIFSTLIAAVFIILYTMQRKHLVN